MSTLRGGSGRRKTNHMVVVVIRSLFYDEEAGDQKFRQRATVLAEGMWFEIKGEKALVAGGALPVIDVSTGKQVRASDNAEVWARNLPSAFRAGDLIAEIVQDPSSKRHSEVHDESRKPPRISSPTDTSLGGVSSSPCLRFGH